MSDPAELARQLLAVTLLQDRVSGLGKDLRGAWTEAVPPGVSWPVTIPDPDGGKPIPVGKVIRPKGTVTARISDRPAWEAWVRENAPDQILTRKTPCLVTSGDALPAVSIAFQAAVDAMSDDPWSQTKPSWQIVVDSLAAAGYAVVPSRQGEDREEVATVFEEATLKRAKNDGACDLPGISVDKVPGGTVTVTSDAKRNADLARRFLATFDRDELDEIASGTLAVEPPKETA